MRFEGAFVQGTLSGGTAARDTVGLLGLLVGSAVRALRRDVRFAVCLSFTLGCGLSAIGTVYLIANSALFKPLAGVGKHEQVHFVEMRDARGGRFDTSPRVLSLLAQSAPRGALTGYSTRTLQLSGLGAEPPLSVAGSLVASGYFDVLRVRALHGRLLSKEDLNPSRDARVAVIAEDWWRAHLGGDPEAVGKDILINAVRYTIIGVAAEGFQGADRLRHEQVWLPISQEPIVAHRELRPVADVNVVRTILVRIDDGGAREATQAALRERFRTIAPLVPRLRSEYVPTMAGSGGLSATARAQLRRAITLLALIAGLVLAGSLANASNLALLRAVRRQQDTTVYQALGASRGRLVLQQGIEFALVGALTGVVSAAVAYASARALVAGRFDGVPSLSGLAVGWTEVVIIVGASILATMLLGASVSGLTLGTATQKPMSNSRSTAPWGALQATLTSGQIALSMALVVGATLLARTMVELAQVPLGYETSGLRSYLISPAQQAYTRAQQQELQSRLRSGMASQPGLSASAVASAAPFGGRYTGGVVSSPGAVDGGVEGEAVEVSPEFFEALGVRFVLGRTFAGASLEAPREVILGRETARRMFGGVDPIGQSVQCCYYGHPSYTVVGVVEDIRMHDVRDAPPPMMYLPIGSRLAESLEVFAITRSRGYVDADSIIRRVVHQIAPGVAVSRSYLVTDAVRNEVAEERLLALLAITLACVAATLAATGLYVLLANAVARSTREIGIRLALGSTRLEVARHFLGMSSRITCAGMLIGAVLSVALGHALASRLFGVATMDAWTYAAAIACVLLLAFVSSLIPVLRTVRVDPIISLRAE